MAGGVAVRQKDQYDSPWKTLIDKMLPDFLAFFFPMVYKDINWSRPPEFLDKELHKIIREAPGGPNIVDKLVKVWLVNDTEIWLLLHIEVQSQYDSKLDFRVFGYQVRIWDLHKREVVSLVVLADDREGWKPDRFEYEHWGAGITSRFLVSKLLEWNERWEELEQIKNPFAIAVMAHLKTMETRYNPELRAEWRYRFVRGLYDGGFAREHVIEMLRFLEWVMVLPPDEEQTFYKRLEGLDKETKMQWVTSFEHERMLIDRREAVIEALEARFGTISPSLAAELEGIEDMATLKRLHRRAIVGVSKPEELLDEELTAVI